MNKTIMEVIQENVNPVTISNSLYEIMLDWRATVVLIADPSTFDNRKQSRSRLKYKKMLLERYLANFIGVSNVEVRELLTQHFDIKVKS